MSRPAKAYLSKANLIHNFTVIKNAAKNSRIISMVKANAYGHGIRSVAKTLDLYTDFFGVASIDEALILKSVNILKPIILMEGIFSEKELEDASENEFHVVFHSSHQVSWLEKTPLKKPIHAWLKVNTGLGRLGVPIDAVKEFYERLTASCNTVGTVRILSHLACADSDDHPLTAEQLNRFKIITNQFDTEFSLCNSAGLFKLPTHHYDFVRPGLSLYGVSPFSNINAQDLNLKPVMTLKTNLIAVQHMKKGDSIGYGATYYCHKDMPVGVIAFGYGDGYPFAAKNGTPVLINGIKCPLIGRISMDMMTVDLSPLKTCSIDDSVTLWGEDLAIEEIIPFTHDIAWHMLTNIQHRVKFIWV
ncbi:MAG: Alanine racemase [Holosporales bacterium]